MAGAVQNTGLQRGKRQGGWLARCPHFTRRQEIKIQTVHRCAVLRLRWVQWEKQTGGCSIGSNGSLWGGGVSVVTYRERKRWWMKSKGEDTPGRGQQPQVAPAIWNLENGKGANVAEHMSEGACGQGSSSWFKGILGSWVLTLLWSSGVCKGRSLCGGSHSGPPMWSFSTASLCMDAAQPVTSTKYSYYPYGKNLVNIF